MRTEGNERFSRQWRTKIKHPILSTVQNKPDDETEEITRNKKVKISTHNEQKKGNAHLRTGTKKVARKMVSKTWTV
jgi:hypothetical protein